MATHKKLITIELRKDSWSSLLGVATNIQEGLGILRAFIQVQKLEAFSLRINSGSNDGRAANYNRVLQSMKSEDVILLRLVNPTTAPEQYDFRLQNIITNKFIISKPIKSNVRKLKQ